jgi:hypothetical protein
MTAMTNENEILIMRAVLLIIFFDTLLPTLPKKARELLMGFVGLFVPFYKYYTTHFT